MKIFKKKNKPNFREDMYEHYKELFTTSVNELHFTSLQVEHLYSVLDELLTLVNGLEKTVIENALQRHELDKLIHAKLLFKDNKNE
jgi:hypothetical protein